MSSSRKQSLLSAIEVGFHPVCCLMKRVIILSNGSWIYIHIGLHFNGIEISTVYTLMLKLVSPLAQDRPTLFVTCHHYCTSFQTMGPYCLVCNLIGDIIGH